MQDSPFYLNNPFRLTGFNRPAVWLLALILAVFLAGPEPAAAETKMIPASFSQVAAKASPAVVNISTVKLVKGPGRVFRFRGPGGPSDPFQDFFDKFFGDQMPPSERKERSLGSGFLIDPSGLIITNNHVVEGADDIMVKLSDQKEYHAQVLGRDPKTDLALIKLKAEGTFPYLALADSSKVQVGDWVVAIGNPFGLDHTVTAGILSARGRVIGAGPYDDFLQTDASINPGNSGGPLLNLEGEVVGINTAIVAGGTGIGFAIPANLAQGIVKQLKDKGRVVRGWLGVMIQKVTPELAKTLKLGTEKGALVADVPETGPAYKAGLKRGDVIVNFDGKEIKEWSDLPPIVAGTPVGSEVKVKVIREGKEKAFDVKIAELKDERLAAAEPGGAGDLGLSVRELTPEIAQRLGLKETEGVIIAGITDGSPADESGLKPGDLIIEINRQPVKNMSDFRRIAGEAKKGETVLFLVKRGSNTLFFTVTVP
ncbi:MAG: DegQ family serine endoprotease [Thermodesulfobacteriota bacterium]